MSNRLQEAAHLASIRNTPGWGIFIREANESLTDLERKAIDCEGSETECLSLQREAKGARKFFAAVINRLDAIGNAPLVGSSNFIEVSMQ